MLEDRQISALAGQLKKLGFQPDFSKARSRSATSGARSDGGKSKGKGKNRNGKKGDSRQASAERTCWNCGKPGHVKRVCPDPPNAVAILAQAILAQEGLK